MFTLIVLWMLIGHLLWLLIMGHDKVAWSKCDVSVFAMLFFWLLGPFIWMWSDIESRRERAGV